MQNWGEWLRRERLPAAIVDLEAFDRNAQRILSAAGSKNVRVATKSIRVPALIQRVLKMDKRFQGVMSYSTDETPGLRALGISDILVAYPPKQERDVENLQASNSPLRLVVDHEQHLQWIQTAAERENQRVDVVVEMDMSLQLGPLWVGVRRSPICSFEQLRSFLERSKKYPRVRMVGVMSYEAQVAGLGDRNPFKPLMNPIFGLVRRISRSVVQKRRSQIAKVFESAGFKLEIFNGGGSGSLNWSAQEPWLTEVTAGSALLCSHLFDYYSNIHFEPAAYFALPVCRLSKDHLTCSGGGYIASGEPGWDRVPIPVFPTGLTRVSSEGCGEVQTPLKIPRGLRVQIGDPVLFRPAKAGEWLERFNEVYLVKGSQVEKVPTYRGMGWNFF